MRLCEISSCKEKHLAKGLCSVHYEARRWQNYAQWKQDHPDKYAAVVKKKAEQVKQRRQRFSDVKFSVERQDLMEARREQRREARGDHH